MKAKSKVLLGLLVALAMMIMAVPAFADTFTLGEITAPEYAYTDKTIDVSVDVTEGNDATYTATLEDLGTPSILKNTTENAQLTSGTGTITFKDVEINDATTLATLIGKETTLKVTVTGKSGNTQSKQVKVKIDKPLIATYTDVVANGTTGALTKEVEDKTLYGINAVVENDNDEATYQWQFGDPAQVVIADAGKVDAKGWTNVDGEIYATFQKAAAMEDNGKYLRCIVSYRDQQVVAEGYTAKEGDTPLDPSINNARYVTLTVKDSDKLVFTKPVKDDAKTVVTTGQALAPMSAIPDLEAEAKVANVVKTGTKYQWKMNGENVAVADVTTLAKADIAAATKYEPGTYVFTCDAEWTNTDNVTLKATSPAFTLTVVEQPKVKIAEAISKEDNDQTPADESQTGNVYLSAADLEKDQTFTAEVTNPGNVEIVEYSWTVDGKAVAVGADKTSWTGKVAKEQHVVCTVTFKDLDADAKYTYDAKINETSGKLGGGIYTSKESGQNPSNNPIYTIELPDGLFFKEEATDAFGTGKIEVNAPTGLNVDGTAADKKVIAAGAREFSFKFAAPSSDLTKVPYVENMVVTIPNDMLTYDSKGGTNAADAAITDVILPVSDSIGYKITRTALNTDLTVKPKTKVYDGKPIEVTVTGKEDGVGEVSNYRYDTDVENNKTTKKSVSTTAPTDVLYDTDGTTVLPYGMFVDVAEGEQYSAATDVRIGTAKSGTDAFKITQAKANDVKKNGEAYFKWTKEKPFTGQDQKADVDFADGITNAGEITKVTYWQNGVQKTPNEPGEYTIKVTTKANPDKDITDNNVEELTNVEIGTFTITKTVGTDLYVLKETEADYTGEAIVPEIEVKAGAGAVKAVRYFKEGDSSTELTAIVQPGKYDVYVDSEEGEIYAAVTNQKVGTFTINNPAEVKPTYQFATHVQDIGWSKENKSVAPGTSETIGTTGQCKRLEAFALMVPENYTVEGFAHIENYGDTQPTRLTTSPNYQIPEGYVAYEFGTQGKALRIEAVNIGIKDASGKLVDGFEYEVHVENLGWLGAVRNGSFTGTRGQCLRVEAIKLDYAGTPAETKPAEETPAEEKPAEETPAEETPTNPAE